MDLESDVSKKIRELPKEKQKEFANEFYDCLNDREWCRYNNIYFPDPDVKKAKEILFNTRYK